MPVPKYIKVVKMMPYETERILSDLSVKYQTNILTDSTIPELLKLFTITNNLNDLQILKESGKIDFNYATVDNKSFIKLRIKKLD